MTILVCLSDAAVFYCIIIMQEPYNQACAEGDMRHLVQQTDTQSVSAGHCSK